MPSSACQTSPCIVRAEAPGRAGADLAEQPCAGLLARAASQCCGAAGFIHSRNVHIRAARQEPQEKLGVQQAEKHEVAAAFGHINP